MAGCIFGIRQWTFAPKVGNCPAKDLDSDKPIREIMSECGVEEMPILSSSSSSKGSTGGKSSSSGGNDGNWLSCEEAEALFNQCTSIIIDIETNPPNECVHFGFASTECQSATTEISTRFLACLEENEKRACGDIDETICKAYYESQCDL
jgi:hypothetical protein